jgi:methionyl-tRNA formyltransferase
MTKETLVAQLEAAKALTSVVSIDNVIALIQALEPVVVVEKTFKLTQELADHISALIERCLDNNSRDFVDTDSAELTMNYDNKVELESVDLHIDNIMGHVTNCIEAFVDEPDIQDIEPEEADEINAADEIIEASIEAAEDAMKPWEFPQGEAFNPSTFDHEA